MTFQNENLSQEDLDSLTEADMMLIAEKLNAIEPGAGAVEAASNGLLLSDSVLAIGAIIVISLVTFAVVKMAPTLKKISNKA